jgi:hypothetical protein
VSTHPLETYLADCRAIRTTGANAPETSFYPALSALLNEVGRRLKPKVRCVMGLKDQGAGMPDGGLFTESQFSKRGDDKPLPGQMPERGVIEVKPVGTDVNKLVAGEQVARYWSKYRLILVTDLREFVLLGEESGATVVRERYTLAATPKDFWELARHPRKAADEQGVRFVEFIQRVMLHAAPLVDPKDVAWFIASYARDARARVEAAKLPALETLRSALEQALGLKFEGEKGEHFFRSTLVQTLFYGVFAAWVLWHRAGGKGRFEWHNAAWSLHVPMIRALFEQLAVPSKLRPLGLEEPLDLTAATLNRVTRAEFFKRFEDRHAVQYFYEPFLQAFDPELRKQLGVWYTPEEIVRYMVRRVDQVLVSELGIADGLADPQVYVLDPCCGTGAYLVETLALIAERLKEKDGDALVAQRLKKAMTERIFGFEVLPAPFVVSHLQIGLLLTGLGAPLGEKERAGVYLTNALTGWEPPKGPKKQITFPFPELQAEHDAAELVKHEKPILVILGNPPYNGYAGTAMNEERDLSNAYRTTIRAPKPKGQGLNDLYVRFFRMAERRIVEQSGRGVVCFISNYSWLDGLSFPGMRERYLEVFDRIWIDSLNGDKYRTGKLTPDGQSDPSVFSTEYNREGIQVGTAVSLLVKQKDVQSSGAKINWREWWGKSKLNDIDPAQSDPSTKAYQVLAPDLAIGLPFAPSKIGSTYLAWPLLPELFPVSFPGVKTSRDDALIDIDRDQLVARMRRYFDPLVSNEEIGREIPALMDSTARFNASTSRSTLLKRGLLNENMVRYSYRPFDNRWLYWEPETKLLDEKRTEYFAQAFEGNRFIEARQKIPQDQFDRGYTSRFLCDNFGNGLSFFFPLLLQTATKSKPQFDSVDFDPIANLSSSASNYVSARSASAAILFEHALSILHTPSYRAENAGGLRQDWPRIALPATRELLEKSANLGRQLAALMDVDVPVTDVSSGGVRKELREIAVIARLGGGSLDPSKGHLALSAGWGHSGKGGVTMPGKGRLATRAAPQLPPALGTKVHDVFLNDVAYWANVPEKVWEYTIGGYQVMKKWLSYRERPLLGRDLTMEEAEYVTEMSRRIAAILLMTDALDENYRACKANTWTWPKA